MIYELYDFLSPVECNKYIDIINTNTNVVPFTDNGNFTNNKWRDIEEAELFYKRLETFNLCDNILRPNNIIMSGKYKVCDSFFIHTDTGLYYDKVKKEKTRWTLLIYLNDNFEGGETVFYNDKWIVNKIVQPKEGMAILFDIDLWHKANPLLKGEKYWIGCEIIGHFK
jgi:hypothetical protein